MNRYETDQNKERKTLPRRWAGHMTRAGTDNTEESKALRTRGLQWWRHAQKTQIKMGLGTSQKILMFFLFIFCCVYWAQSRNTLMGSQKIENRLQTSGWPFLVSFFFLSPVFHFPSVFLHFHWFIFKKIKFHVFSFVCSLMFLRVSSFVFMCVHFVFSITVCHAPLLLCLLQNSNVHNQKRSQFQTSVWPFLSARVRSLVVFNICFTWLGVLNASFPCFLFLSFLAFFKSFHVSKTCFTCPVLSWFHFSSFSCLFQRVFLVSHFCVFRTFVLFPMFSLLFSCVFPSLFHFSCFEMFPQTPDVHLEFYHKCHLATPS